MMFYYKIVQYAIKGETPEIAEETWADDGPELAGTRTIEEVDATELIPAHRGGMGATPNGYDPLWIAAINGVLEDRESDVRIDDLDDELWERFFGPLIDFFEDGA